jgi:hypothetical protein
LRTQFAQAEGLPFADLLSSQRLQPALEEEKATWRQELWTPLLTLWAFLSQVLSPDGSCRQAVCRVLAWLVSSGQEPCTPRTDPYCKARKRLPESLLSRLVRETGQELHQKSPKGWRWLGRPVKIADGTTVSMPDTAANQAAYPQPGSQQPGLGFPIARLVVVFCLASGSVLEAALGRYRGKQQGENSLLRGLEGAFQPGDVLLADRCYGGWFDLACWLQRGVDMVTRLHQSRRCDLRRGRRLGKGDHVVFWAKPVRPQWMDEPTYQGLPQQLELREVRVQVKQPGFRTKVYVLVTTLLEAKVYPAKELARLYRLRWQAELDLCSLKVTLGMDVLRCKSPEMVAKEVWAHLLAYNLIRGVMAQAAAELEADPRKLSFKGAVQAITAFAERLLEAEGQRYQELYEWLLLTIGAYAVGERPDRVEPRARKRRPKGYPLLSKPRHEARKKLLQKR